MQIALIALSDWNSDGRGEIRFRLNEHGHVRAVACGTAYGVTKPLAAIDDRRVDDPAAGLIADAVAD